MDYIRENCSLCAEINNIDNKYNYFSNYFQGFFKSKDRVVYSSNKWIIIPTAGCFVEGYILLVNKSHYTSFYNCPILDKMEVLNKIELCKKMFKQIYKSKFVLFEHGIVTDSYRGSCCIDHTHLHMIPFNEDIWADLLTKYNFKSYKIESILHLEDIIVKNNIKSYLLFQNVDESIYIIDSTFDIFPSQFFRHIFFRWFHKDLIDKDYWDWRHYFYINKMFNTYTDVNRFFLDNINL